MRDINTSFRHRRPPPERPVHKKSPEKIQKVLEMALGRFGLRDKLNKYQFVLHWAEIVGEDIAKRSKPEYIKNKTLVVRAQDSTWSQELSFHKKVIINRLNKFLGEDLISDVLFIVG